ncbi:MAG: DUF177 domain-containing protein [Acidobacteria bacterium]|nr:DUF177 domain-containing protein [Acidobacteriota bacterium]
MVVGVVFSEAGSVLIEVAELQRRVVQFDSYFAPGAIVLADSDWRQDDRLHVVGVAELLDRQGSRTIRVRGEIDGQVAGPCARCLELVSEQVHEKFDLYYYPMAMIARSEEIRIERDDTDIGFYEERGLELGDVVREQLLLWLPMRALCDENCQGFCPTCGNIRGSAECRCQKNLVDPRWDTLRHVRSKLKS